MKEKSLAHFILKAKMVSKTLEESRIPHWLEFGTLLGAVRAGKMIQWDTDVDFGFFFPDKPRFLSLRPKFKKIGLGIMEIPGELVRLVPVDGFSYGVSWMDFYPCMKQGSDLFPLPVPGTVYKHYHVDELERINFEGFDFPCPRYREKLLALRYGDTWRIPQRDGWEIRNMAGVCSTPDFVNEGNAEGPITGYTEGAFDLFHIGHLNLLRRGKEIFDRLVVGVNSDATVRRYKRKPIIPSAQRLAIVTACKYVDEVIEDAPLVTTLRFMKRHPLDYVLHGRAPGEWLDQFYREPRKANKLHLISETEGIHTTNIVEKIKSLAKPLNHRASRSGSPAKPV